jgi:hypothetical protein
MKYFCAALWLCTALCGGPAFAKDTCTHTWAKGNYKTFKQVQGELRERLSNAKILKFSLCGSANEHYFQVTILKLSGKVLVIRVPAR